ncbi:hypothetical protein OPKNFCMD_3866 [Methylobacterium crusticola]|uniref:Uncharacterized protein n=1 Tax=Methylobacterium crusticola TaxID=1697972 RepID=A0ABQ4R2C8_9HYPH|nr:hypothetical protein [Methylobacterium crusticola]GJD51115.1 hypothetical protein OPKNFCMD_3866 [Methylobacterium crusticola]
MLRCPHEEAEVLDALADWLAAKPEAGFIVGYVEIGQVPGEIRCRIGDVACGPAGLVVLAAELLRVASEEASALPACEARRDLMVMIKTARATLQFRNLELAS